MSVKSSNSCVHGIDFSGVCSDCANENARKKALAQTIQRNTKHDFIQRVLVAVASSAHANLASIDEHISYAEEVWDALEAKGYV